MVERGDRILVEAEKVGTPPRAGIVTGIDGRLIHVRWESGAESTFVPSAGSLRVVGRGGEAASAPRVSGREERGRGNRTGERTSL